MPIPYSFIQNPYRPFVIGGLGSLREIAEPQGRSLMRQPAFSLARAVRSSEKVPDTFFAPTSGDVHLDSVDPFAAGIPGSLGVHGLLDVARFNPGSEACGH